MPAASSEHGPPGPKVNGPVQLGGAEAREDRDRVEAPHLGLVLEPLVEQEPAFAPGHRVDDGGGSRGAGAPVPPDSRSRSWLRWREEEHYDLSCCMAYWRVRAIFRPWRDHGGGRAVRAVIAFLLLIAMLAIGARVHGVRQSRWKFLAFATACIMVLALVLAILA